MNQPDHNILNELQELSPALAAIPRVNVFKVPEGYFDSLPMLLLLQINNEQNAGINKATVPEGYFDGLASDIMARIKKENTASAPDSTIIDSIGNRNVFRIPEGYFAGLSSSIMDRIKEQSSNDVMAETSNISELIAGIGNRNVFSVPAGYFENLPVNIHSKLVQPAKVVSMGSRKRIVKYAAAAVVTGFLAISAFFILSKNEKDTDLAAAIKTADSIIKTNSFDKEIAGLNDADIVNFLESKGQDVNAALVASLTEDDKTLPEAEDYLINENTLDEVLKNLDLNN